MKERICLVCRRRDVASNRIRVARVDGEFFVDRVGNMNGRGAYVCVSCIPSAIKKKSLNRSFKTNVPPNIYEELLALTENL